MIGGGGGLECHNHGRRDLSHGVEDVSRLRALFRGWFFFNGSSCSPSLRNSQGQLPSAERKISKSFTLLSQLIHRQQYQHHHHHDGVPFVRRVPNLGNHVATPATVIVIFLPVSICSSTVILSKVKHVHLSITIIINKRI